MKLSGKSLTLLTWGLSLSLSPEPWPDEAVRFFRPKFRASMASKAHESQWHQKPASLVATVALATSEAGFRQLRQVTV